MSNLPVLRDDLTPGGDLYEQAKTALNKIGKSWRESDRRHERAIGEVFYFVAVEGDTVTYRKLLDHAADICDVTRDTIGRWRTEYQMANQLPPPTAKSAARQLASKERAVTAPPRGTETVTVNPEYAHSSDADGAEPLSPPSASDVPQDPAPGCPAPGADAGSQALTASDPASSVGLAPVNSGVTGSPAPSDDGNTSEASTATLCAEGVPADRSAGGVSATREGAGSAGSTVAITTSGRPQVLEHSTGGPSMPPSAGVADAPLTGDEVLGADGNGAQGEPATAASPSSSSSRTPLSAKAGGSSVAKRPEGAISADDFNWPDFPPRQFMDRAVRWLRIHVDAGEAQLCDRAEVNRLRNALDHALTVSAPVTPVSGGRRPYNGPIPKAGAKR